MRTPLSKVRGMGSAGSGTGHFWHQRLTAIANLPLAIFVLWLLASAAGGSHAEVVERLSSGPVAIALLLAIVSIAYHMKLGMQVIIEDYVHGEGTKMALVIANLFFTLAVSAIAVFSVLTIAFGS